MTIFTGSYNGNLKNHYAAKTLPGVALFQYYLNATSPPLSLVARTQEQINQNILSITVSALSHTKVRVTFSAPVIVNRVLLDINNYIFSPSLNVLTIVPDNANIASYVDVTVDGMSGISYSLTVLNIEAA